MTDLKFATKDELLTELELRRELDREALITSRIGEILDLHAKGQISAIQVDERNIGTSVVTTKYFIHLK